jgi:hypothetical protein
VATKELADTIGTLGSVVSVKSTDTKAKESELLVARVLRLVESVVVVGSANRFDDSYATVAVVEPS